jgi:hypothetical protein
VTSFDASSDPFLIGAQQSPSVPVEAQPIASDPPHPGPLIVSTPVLGALQLVDFAELTIIVGETKTALNFATAERKHGDEEGGSPEDPTTPRAIDFLEGRKIFPETPKIAEPLCDNSPQETSKHEIKQEPGTGARSMSMSSKAAALIDWGKTIGSFVQFGKNMFGDKITAYYVREGLKDVSATFAQEYGFEGLVLSIVNTGEHFVVEGSLETGFWYHDGCSDNGESCVKEKASDSPVYFLLALKDEFLRADWKEQLSSIKVTNKWEKLQLACRFTPGQEQILRSCSVDGCTVIVALVRELCLPGVDIFEVAGKLSKTCRVGSKGVHVKLQTKALRDDFARLVVGALKVFHTSTEDTWKDIIDTWSNIPDGTPDYVDWDAAEVLSVLAACKDLTVAEIEQCLQASYPDFAGIDINQDMDEEQEALNKEIIQKQSLRTSRALADDKRSQAATDRFKNQMQKGFHGFDTATGQMRTKMGDGSDILDRIHISSRWEIDSNINQTR